MQPQRTCLAVLVLAGLAPVVNAEVQIGVNITGSTYGEGGFTCVPPDTMGAVGPDHFVELINCRFAVYSKLDGQLVYESSDRYFWNEIAGSTSWTGAGKDPRILYDPYAQRWFACAIDLGRGDNNVMLAISQTPDPTQAWRGLAFDPDPTGCYWLDFPTLGFDSVGVYIRGQMVRLGSCQPTSPKTLIILPKADLLLDPPTDANKTIEEDLAGYPVQPVVNWDNSGLPGRVLGLNPFHPISFHLISVTGSINDPIVTVGDPIQDLLAGFSGGAGDQPGPKADITASTIKIPSSPILRDGVIWAVHNRQRVGGRMFIHWHRIDPSLNEMGVTRVPLCSPPAFSPHQ